MKISYKGQELETITEGYWPEGVTLVYTDDFEDTGEIRDVVCLHNGFAFIRTGDLSFQWNRWAILQPKPAPRRLTNREAFCLCRKGWDVFYNYLVGTTFWYPKDEDNIAIEDGTKLRAPGSDEWVDPTSDLLEV